MMIRPRVGGMRRSRWFCAGAREQRRTKDRPVLMLQFRRATVEVGNVSPRIARQGTRKAGEQGLPRSLPGRTMRHQGAHMTCVSIVAAAVLLTVPAVAVYPQEHAHPQVGPTENLGTVHFATSCSPTVAPQFDRAVALLHSFEFGASIRAFNEV